MSNEITRGQSEDPTSQPNGRALSDLEALAMVEDNQAVLDIFHELHILDDEYESFRHDGEQVCEEVTQFFRKLRAVQESLHGTNDSG